MKRLLAKAYFPGPDERSRILAEKIPQAEAFAAVWMERLRPCFIGAYGFRRRAATIAIFLLTAILLVHVMFGANGMVVYRQKRAEYQNLLKQKESMQQENDRIRRQIQALQTDRKAIEKEAREQLGYAKPGEFVYVAPPPNKPEPPETHSAEK